MNYEVEVKFRIKDPDLVRERLLQLGAVEGEVQQHRDTYYNHPARDFATTDEAFRIRSIGDANRLTYKGPLVDTQTKTRQEVEVGCDDGEAGHAGLRTLLTALSFREVFTVCKRRSPFLLTWEGCSVEATIDVVESLGTFVELETIATEAQWKMARDRLAKLAEALDLKDSVRTSYLQMLMATDG